eukprot:gb/GECG01013606.1/.p1 GENE.gb/GECG01013606.1/~~gb/GECG01013606.1/.p1  ORF type:complete len:1214 (+),score=190.39 gb/GECG01013606.1/:1-3642(+)
MEYHRYNQQQGPPMSTSSLPRTPHPATAGGLQGRTTERGNDFMHPNTTGRMQSTTSGTKSLHTSWAFRRSGQRGPNRSTAPLSISATPRHHGVSPLVTNQSLQSARSSAPNEPTVVQQESVLARTYREAEMLDSQQQQRAPNNASAGWQSPYASAVRQRFDRIHQVSPAPKVLQKTAHHAAFAASIANYGSASVGSNAAYYGQGNQHVGPAPPTTSTYGIYASSETGRYFSPSASANIQERFAGSASAVPRNRSWNIANQSPLPLKSSTPVEQPHRRLVAMGVGSPKPRLAGTHSVGPRTSAATVNDRSSSLWGRNQEASFTSTPVQQASSSGSALLSHRGEHDSTATRLFQHLPNQDASPGAQAELPWQRQLKAMGLSSAIDSTLETVRARKLLEKQGYRVLPLKEQQQGYADDKREVLREMNSDHVESKVPDKSRGSSADSDRATGNDTNGASRQAAKADKDSTDEFDSISVGPTEVSEQDGEAPENGEIEETYRTPSTRLSHRKPRQHLKEHTVPGGRETDGNQPSSHVNEGSPEGIRTLKNTISSSDLHKIEDTSKSLGRARYSKGNRNDVPSSQRKESKSPASKEEGRNAVKVRVSDSAQRSGGTSGRESKNSSSKEERKSVKTRGHDSAQRSGSASREASVGSGELVEEGRKSSGSKNTKKNLSLLESLSSTSNKESQVVSKKKWKKPRKAKIGRVDSLFSLSNPSSTERVGKDGVSSNGTRGSSAPKSDSKKHGGVKRDRPPTPQVSSKIMSVTQRANKRTRKDNKREKSDPRISLENKLAKAMSDEQSPHGDKRKKQGKAGPTQNNKRAPAGQPAHSRQEGRERRDHSSINDTHTNHPPNNEPDLRKGPSRKAASTASARISATSYLESQRQIDPDFYGWMEQEKNQSLSVQSSPEDGKQAAENSTPVSVSTEIANGGWSNEEVCALRNAYHQFSVVLPNFWQLVAEHVGTDKSAAACREKWSTLQRHADTYTGASSRPNKQPKKAANEGHGSARSNTENSNFKLAKKGTVKRRRQVRDIVNRESQQERADDIFESIERVHVSTPGARPTERTSSGLSTFNTSFGLNTKSARKRKRQQADDDESASVATSLWQDDSGESPRILRNSDRGEYDSFIEQSKKMQNVGPKARYNVRASTMHDTAASKSSTPKRGTRVAATPGKQIPGVDASMTPGGSTRVNWHMDEADNDDMVEFQVDDNGEAYIVRS